MIMMRPPKVQLVGVVGVGLGLLTWLWAWSRRRRVQTSSRLVAITGCDSGIGFSAAVHSLKRGFHVLAMVLNIESNGAQTLISLKKEKEKIIVMAVDVTKSENISVAVQQINHLLKEKDLKFHALVNNAGVMVFGEMEWQTERLMSWQLDVNLLGPMKVTKHFAPLLRADKGRVINVSSHCSSLPLPGLAVYAASKAGIQAWSDALRVEWAKYGITVSSLVPGGFFQQTNILSRQSQYAQEMQEAMTVEAKEFYGQYYSQYQSYLSGLAGEKPAVPVQSDQLYAMLDSALLDVSPSPHYADTPWRYTMYHFLAHSLGQISTPLRDKLVVQFTAMPEYKP